MNCFHCFSRTAIVAAILPIFVVTSNTSAAEPGDAKTPVEVITGDQAGEDPFLGDWQGKWTKGYPPQIVAQVIPRGDDNYAINFLPAFDQRCPAYATVQAKVVEGKLSFNQDGWSGSFEGDQLIGQGLLRGKPTDFQLAKITRLSPRLGEKPPKDATVLFDGGSLDAWESDGRGGVEEITWKQVDDFLRVWPPLTEHSFSAAIRTRKAYSSFREKSETKVPGRIILQHHGDPIDFRNIWIVDISRYR